MSPILPFYFRLPVHKSLLLLISRQKCRNLSFLCNSGKYRIIRKDVFHIALIILYTLIRNEPSHAAAMA